MLEPWAFIAIGIAVGLFGILAVQTVVIPQQAEASCVTGYLHSGNTSAIITAFEKSEGRCFAR
jgi:hypothetical protein